MNSYSCYRAVLENVAITNEMRLRETLYYTDINVNYQSDKTTINDVSMHHRVSHKRTQNCIQNVVLYMLNRERYRHRN